MRAARQALKAVDAIKADKTLAELAQAYDVHPTLHLHFPNLFRCSDTRSHVSQPASVVRKVLPDFGTRSISMATKYDDRPIEVGERTCVSDLHRRGVGNCREMNAVGGEVDVIRKVRLVGHRSV